MSREEAEALGLFAQQHRSQVAVPEADLAVFRHRAGDTERLQAFADGFSRISRFSATLLQSDRRAQHIGPLRVLEADVLDTVADVVRVEALVLTQLASLLEILDPVLFADRIDLFDATRIAFEKCHK